MLVIPAVGVDISCVIVIDSLSLHPVDVDVVVIVYVPGEENVFVFHPGLLPPVHENVLPFSPVKLIDVVLHVSSVVPVLFVILADGLLFTVPLHATVSGETPLVDNVMF